MIKKYDFDYNNGEAGASFTVDTEKFNPELVKAYLEFFSWDYDDEEDPLDELMKKYGMQAIKIATSENFNEHGVKGWFEEAEGFPNIDGSVGIELTYVEEYEFDERSLFVNIG
jgi:hypothetical protein